MRSIRPVLFAAASVGLAVAIASPADAKQCGSGQIFQVSKGRCISKAAAAKAGIVVRHKAAALKAAREGAVRPEADEEETPSSGTPAARGGSDVAGKDSATQASETSDQARSDQVESSEAAPPVRNVAVRNDPAKAREAWNAAVAAAGKGGEAASAPALSFAPLEGDVTRNIAPFGALQFGGLR